jgi:hypothetical protein
MELTRKQKAAVEWVFTSRQETRRGWWMLPVVAVGLACVFGISWASKGTPDWRFVPFILLAAVGAVWPRHPGQQRILHCVVFAAMMLVAWLLEGAESVWTPLFVVWLLYNAWLIHRMLILAEILEAAGIPAPERPAEQAVEDPES